MRKLMENEVEGFVKESYDFIGKQFEENNFKMCVVCYPTYWNEGQFNGLKFGYMEDDLAKSIYDSCEKASMPIAISFEDPFKRKCEVAKIIKKHTTCIYKDASGNIVDEDAVWYDEDNSIKEETSCSITKEEAEQIWLNEKLSVFKDRIEFIKDKILKINY